MHWRSVGSHPHPGHAVHPGGGGVVDWGQSTGREDRIAVRAEHGPAQRRVDHPRLQVAHGAQAAVRPRTYRVRCGAGRGDLAPRPRQLLRHLSHTADGVEPLAGHVGVV